MAVVASRRQKQKAGVTCTTVLPTQKVTSGVFLYSTEMLWLVMGTGQWCAPVWKGKPILLWRQSLKPYRQCPLSSLSPPDPHEYTEHWNSHSYTCSQVSYEPPCIYTLFYGRTTRIRETSGQRFHIGTQGSCTPPRESDELGESAKELSTH